MSLAGMFDRVANFAYSQAKEQDISIWSANISANLWAKKVNPCTPMWTSKLGTMTVPFGSN